MEFFLPNGFSFGEVDFEEAKAFALRRFEGACYLHRIVDFDRVENLLGLDEQLGILRANTASFLSGKDALNVLAWGARGCGKSSCVKRVLGEFLGIWETKTTKSLDNTKTPTTTKTTKISHSTPSQSTTLRVIELDSKDILLLPLLFDTLRTKPYKFIIFCDDLSFRIGQSEYKSIKSVLEGSLERRAKNILLYATSNIRKLIENAGADHSPEHSIVQEELSFSDRFGLQIGFYDFGTSEYLACVEEYLANIKGVKKLDLRAQQLDEASKIARQKALNFAAKMGSKNARIAKDFALLVANGVEKIDKI